MANALVKNSQALVQRPCKSGLTKKHEDPAYASSSNHRFPLQTSFLGKEDCNALLLSSWISSTETQSRRGSLPQVMAVSGSVHGSRWWQKGSAPNMKDVNSIQDFLDSLFSAGEKLVVVDFYAPWCGTCRSMYPKLCQIAEENPDVVFLKVNFDANKTLCQGMNVSVLPLFHFYRGAEGRLTSFSCSLGTIKKLKNAIAKHNTDRCSLRPSLDVDEQIQILGLSSNILATFGLSPTTLEPAPLSSSPIPSSSSSSSSSTQNTSSLAHHV